MHAGGRLALDERAPASIGTALTDHKSVGSREPLSAITLFCPLTLLLENARQVLARAVDKHAQTMKGIPHRCPLLFYERMHCYRNRHFADNASPLMAQTCLAFFLRAVSSDRQAVKLEVHRAVTQLVGGDAQLVQDGQMHVGNWGVDATSRYHAARRQPPAGAAA